MLVGKPPTPGRSAVSKRRSQLAAVLITMVCALLLAVGSCFGALVTYASNRSLSNLLGILVMVFAFVFVVAFLALVVRLVMSLFERGK
jgi:hypothetical protein